MMWCKHGDRRDVLESLYKKKIFASAKFVEHDSVKAPKEGKILMIWFSEPTHLNPAPTLLVFPTGEMRDFLAWSASFIKEFSPISSIVRVVEWATFLAARSVKKRTADDKLMAVLVYFVIGETYLIKGDNRNAARPDYLRTLSFALSQAIIAGYEPPHISRVASSWVAAHRFESSAVERASAYSEICKAIFYAFSDLDREKLSKTDDMRQASALCELIHNGKISVISQNEILGVTTDFSELTEKSSTDRESQIRKLDIIQRELSALPGLDDSNYAFILAFLLSSIEPGSLDFISLAAADQRSGSLTAIWYSIFTGIKATHDDRPTPTLGRFIVRDLNMIDTSLTDTGSDLAVEELEMLLSVGRSLQGLTCARPGRVSVEILPGVYTLLLVAQTEEMGGDYERRKKEELDQARLLTEARYALESASAALDRAMRGTYTSNPRQRKR